MFIWALSMIYISELFPTCVRGLALGFTSIIGSIGKFIFKIIT